ncbi:hypothetical protein M405DRAFT_837374 [Rhizopogon salebrosus TDB-379]|nr:hypothetical protein M405DRAFT_837374 [Rhizopogon salebrosus TDB-379]
MTLESWKVPWIAKPELLLLADAKVARGWPREYLQESEENVDCKDDCRCRIPRMDVGLVGETGLGLRFGVSARARGDECGWMDGWIAVAQRVSCHRGESGIVFSWSAVLQDTRYLLTYSKSQVVKCTGQRSDGNDGKGSEETYKRPVLHAVFAHPR